MCIQSNTFCQFKDSLLQNKHKKELSDNMPIYQGYDKVLYRSIQVFTEIYF